MFSAKKYSLLRLILAVFLLLLLLVLISIPVLSDRRVAGLLCSPLFLVTILAAIIILCIGRGRRIDSWRIHVGRTMPSLILIVVMLLLMEILLRIFNPIIFSHSEFQRDSRLGVRAKPFFSFGEIKTNQLGYNDRDHSFANPDNSYRILVLGDSFSWAGLQKNYILQLGRLLQDKYPDRIEVINAGWPGLGPVDLENLLLSEGLHFQPDLVGMAFFVGNDFFENYHRKTALRNGKLTHIPLPWKDDKLTVRAFVKYIKRESYLLDILRKLKAIVVQVVEKEIEDEGETGLMSRRSYLEFEYYRTPLFLRDLSISSRQQISQIEEVIVRINRRLQEEGIEFFLVIIPDEIQVNYELRQEVINEFNLSSRDYDFGQPQRFLRKICRENSIPVIDILPELTRLGGSRRTYKLRDSHWNGLGNMLAAEIICKFLTNNTNLFTFEPAVNDQPMNGE
jgi:hypothetical protein